MKTQRRPPLPGLRAVAVLVVTAVAVGVVTLSLSAGEREREPELSPGQGPDVGPPAPRNLRRLQVNERVRLNASFPSVVEFFAGYIGSREVAEVILKQSLSMEVPVNLAFSLAWGESRYNPLAVSGHNLHGTRDWGLFQLNDGGRPEWAKEDFFDIGKNTRSGLSFLRTCILEMGSVEMGLAAYNAGIYGVRQWGVPSSTQRHVRAITEYERELDRAFNRHFPTLGW